MTEEQNKDLMHGETCDDPGCGCHHHEEAFDIHDILPTDPEELASCTITMADEETGEEFTFFMADDFEMDGVVYTVLLSLEEDPEAIFVKVVDLEDGTEGFETLDDEEFERVADFYEELCASDAAEDEDEEEEEGGEA